MSVQRLIHFFDEKVTSLTLHVGVEQNVLLSFLFHGLFLSTHEMLFSRSIMRDMIFNV